MSIEDMIMDLDSALEDDGISASAHESIIAALRRLERLERAGQALAFEAEVAERAFCRLHMDAHGTEAIPVAFACVSKARRAWDAATKGDDE